MDREPELVAAPALDAIRARVDLVLDALLVDRRAEIATLAPEATVVIDELRRLVGAGGKRIRPAFCYWGHRAAGGEDGEPIVRVGAALELFHTFAIVHDDVMDESGRRRGVPTTQARFAAERAGAPDAERYGRSMAVLAGDLAAVLADRAFLDAGFPPDLLIPALRRYTRMRIEVAAGQLLDISGAAATSSGAARAAALKTGSYTVEGPLHIGALLAGGSPDILAALSRFAVPLGLAFQLRDDVLDRDRGDAAPTPARVNGLIEQATSALNEAAIADDAAKALRSLAEALALPGGPTAR